MRPKQPEPAPGCLGRIVWAFILIVGPLLEFWAAIQIGRIIVGG